MTPPRYVCIHGHFYQPPRDNPWLEAIEVQDSAAPYHDWNERITRECYAPNTRSRLVDDCGQIVGLLNNYAWMSFNFGPTLVSWLAEHAPEVLADIVTGDRVSRQRHHGHGNALAQVYNHMILPLAGPRDKQTQVLWGIADFRHRFGRDPEGMWLPETAVDLASLEVLSAAGIRFTILAPGQAKRWRKLDDKEWTELPGGVDPSRAYLCRLPSGKSIALFFYDGPIARQVAFERLLDRGEQFLARLMQGFDGRRTHAQLVHIATDGESYGHHHTFGDMALAYVLHKLGQDANVRLTNYGEFLELHPPEWEVEIHENSSWSCGHGVERWRADCGCRVRGDWQAGWRAPLRKAFDQLKGRLDSLFGTRARQCFRDPWDARNAYLAVILDRSPESVHQFFQQHGYADLDEPLTREGLWLLEMQRHGMLMFTSCGWFFDEISGLETTQCLRYAARAIQLARHFDQEFETEFVQALEKAPSNLARFRNGRGVWEQLVRPWQIDLERVLAHYAISSIYAPPEARSHVYCYDLECLDQEVETRGTNHVAVGRLRVRSRVTWSRADANYVVIHYGGLDFHIVLKKERSAEEYETFKKRLLDTYRHGSLADVTALVAQEFPGDVRRLEDLFHEGQRRIIGIALSDRFEDYQATFERLANQDEDLLNRLGRLHHPIPKPLWMAASAYLDLHLKRQIDDLATDGSLTRIQGLYERGRTWGYQPERELLAKTMAEALQRLLDGIGPETDLAALTTKVSQLLDAAALLAVPLDPWQAQNRLLDVYARLAAAGSLREPLREACVTLAGKLHLSPSLLGWRP